MPYITPEVVQKVKRLDLLTYQKNYEPYESVHFSGNTYTTRTHDSLKISNGKWMLTKEEIKIKIPSSERELLILDYVFEAILEQRRIYKKNRRRRSREFRDWDYICCSIYGNPRSKSYHHKYYKEFLESLELPDIHFRQLRNTYMIILIIEEIESLADEYLRAV